MYCMKSNFKYVTIIARCQLLFLVVDTWLVGIEVATIGIPSSNLSTGRVQAVNNVNFLIKTSTTPLGLTPPSDGPYSINIAGIKPNIFGSRNGDITPNFSPRGKFKILTFRKCIKLTNVLMRKY